MKTYVLTLSKTFPAKHPRKGEPTEFRKSLENTIKFLRHEIEPNGIEFYKLYTIRGNYERMKYIIDEVNAGNAELSVREWSGVPYRSKQEEIARFTKDDNLGCQMLRVKCYDYDPVFWGLVVDEKTIVRKDTMANSDGLLKEDWINWFRLSDLSKPLAIIHFTKFRY